MVARPSRPRPANAREWARALLFALGLLGLYFVAPLGQDDDPMPLPAALALSVLVALGLAVMIGRRILQVLDGTGSPASTGSTGLPSLVSVLVLVVVAFASTYFMLDRSDPGQVAGLSTRLDALYFTLTTLVTVGYGDIYPEGQAARAIACLQFVFNAVFVVGLVRAMLYQAQIRRALGR